MDGIHDMGGIDRYGSIDPADEETFHASWEARVFALSLAASVHLKSNSDRTRYRLERLKNDEYLQGYFQRWFISLIKGCRDAGLITTDEFGRINKGKTATAKKTAHADDVFSLNAEFMLGLLANGAPSVREETKKPIFKISDQVAAIAHSHPTHTRLPAYVRGKPGVITAYRGAHVFPDSNAVLKGEDPKPLYAVQFRSHDLWPEAAGSKDSVTLDLWEPYLEASK
jgi:nitrile hydratase